MIVNLPDHPKIKLQHVLLSIAPSIGWVVENGNKIVWTKPNSSSNPTEKDIMKAFKKLLAEYDANIYKELRKVEYDKLNQLEMQFDDMENGTTTWIDAINHIKKLYPKGSTS